MIAAYITLALLVLGIGIYVWLFYPQQLIDPKTILPVEVTTPEPEKYHNDVLHPCIRKMSNGKYVMVQSPWYKCQDGIENPILYISDDPMHWDNGIIVEDTPAKGYNSDPTVFEENGRVYVLWREVETPFCEANNTTIATVGVYTDDYGKSFSEKKIYIANDDIRIDTEMSPIVIKYKEKYRIYASWYQMWRKDRHNLGIAIWEGTSLENPDFKLCKNVPFKEKMICDKFKQIKLFGHYFFFPKPHKFDLWHFDLFEKAGILYMVASEEDADVVMLAVSEDWENFRMIRKPLINSFCMQNIVDYRQKYYKSTVVVEDKNLRLFYTANPQEQYFTHQLYTSLIKFVFNG